MKNNKITRVGKIIRQHGLDEIMQFFNVLKGDMSIVGPRPLTKDDIARLGWDQPSHKARWSHKPGITGMAQVFAGQGAEVYLFYEHSYIDNQSLILDLKLLCVSFVVNIIGKRRTQVLLKRWNILEGKNLSDQKNEKKDIDSGR